MSPKKTESESARYLSMTQTSAIYGLSRRMQYKLIKEGAIRSVVLGRNRFNDVESLERAFTHGHAQP
jgi:predicted DNA-binding transcriptional regulator AlpA